MFSITYNKPINMGTNIDLSIFHFIFDIFVFCYFICQLELFQILVRLCVGNIAKKNILNKL